MRKILLVAVIGLSLLLVACNGANGKTGDPVITNPSTQPAGNQDGNDDPIGIPDVEDSIFDDSDTSTVPAQSVTVPATEPEETEPGETKPTEPTNPTEPQDPDAPDEPDPTMGGDDEPAGSDGPDLSMTYEQFQNLTPAQMRQFEESFASKDAFFDWYNAAKKAYEEANPPIDVGSGTVTLPNN